jgi:hypothetical protein
VALRLAEVDVSEVLKGPLSDFLAVKQWGIAMGHRWGHCITDISCLAYKSKVIFGNSMGGGPCVNCKQYPAAHVHLGRYPTRCSVPGCPCSEFHPENDPTNTNLDGDYHQAHNNLLCGVCGHSSRLHCAPFHQWEVQWHDIDVLEKVGEGRHGRVHRCTLAGHDDVYAVKILRDERWSARALSNFLREMSMLSTMRHPHILGLVAGCTDSRGAQHGGGSVAIITEFAANGDLRDVLLLQPPQISRDVWLQMAVDIARGLGYLHSHKPPIIHRALKAQNCMVDAAWRVRVADFGLSGHIGKDSTADTHELDMTPTTATMAAYMSPELLKLSAAKTRTKHMDISTTVHVRGVGGTLEEEGALAKLFGQCGTVAQVTVRHRIDTATG